MNYIKLFFLCILLSTAFTLQAQDEGYDDADYWEEAPEQMEYVSPEEAEESFQRQEDMEQDWSMDQEEEELPVDYESN